MKIEDIDIIEEAFDIDAGKKVIVKQLTDMAKKLDRVISSERYDKFSGSSAVRSTVSQMKQFKKQLDSLEIDIDLIEKMAKKV